MARYEFPALGFDPARGDVAAVEGLQHDVQNEAGMLGDVAQHLAGLHADTWTGKASDAFHAEVKTLPDDLGKAAHAYNEVAIALRTYATELANARAEALRLEQQAQQARQMHQAALGQVNQLATAPPGETAAQQSQRVSQLQSAQQQSEILGGDLQSILNRAQALMDHLDGVASAAAQRIDAAAATPPYHAPGFLQQAWDSVTSFVREHAAVIRQISSVLKIVSAVAGLLSFIPVLAPFMVPLALATAGVALGLDVLLKLSTGEGSWGAMGVDAVLTFVPGGKLLHLGGVASREAAEVVLAGRAYRGGRGLFAGRAFDPELAGGPIMKLAYLRVRFTPRAVAVVEAHLRRFTSGGELDHPEHIMLDRLKEIASGRLEATVYDRRFYTHELREFVRYRRLGYPTGQPADVDHAYDLWNNAHTATLADYGINPAEEGLYLPGLTT
jgi:uncharacterized protein YukE